MEKLALSFIMAIGVIAGAVIVGALMIASGQILLAIREIALNTRREEKPSEYKTLEIVAVLNNAIGWIIITAGLVIGAYSILMSIRP